MNPLVKAIALCAPLLIGSIGCSKQGKRSGIPKVSSLDSASITVQEQKPDEAFSGAGTAFVLVKPDGSESDVIFGYAMEDEEPIIRINNAPQKVKHISSKVLSEGKGKQGLGRHEQEIWGNSQVTIELDYKTTAVGEGGTGYSGKLTVKMKGQQATFKIKGGSGC